MTCLRRLLRAWSPAAVAIGVVATGSLATGAEAAVAPGGVGAPGTVAIADVTCVARCVDLRKATPGAKVRVRGLAMDQVSKVAFRGATGPIEVPPLRSSEATATARVPRGALSGRPYAIDSAGRASSRSPHKLFILPAEAIPTATFPVRGPHSFWDGFGAGRGHQGVDIGAACGTPLVAALPGRVSRRASHSAAGNYLVIDSRGVDADIAYMHLARPAPVRVGQVLEAGQLVGHVGETGRATGCHLHFEYWLGTWWHGGRAVDPMPYLREWDQGRRSRGAK